MSTILASGPVIVENDKVLLNKHGDTDFYKFCGGRIIDLNESLQAAAKRKAKEEMGIEIEISNPTPFVMYAQKEANEETQDIILVHYLAKRIGEINPNEDIKEWNWIAIDQLKNENLGPNIIPALKHFGFLS